MIDGISGGMMPMPPGGKQGGGSSNPLTDAQKATITETLEQFDASNLTEADAQSIVSAFSEAGIQPGREMAEAMSAAGFNAREVGDLAGVGPHNQGQSQGMGGGMPPPPPPGGGKEGGMNIDESSFEELLSLLEEYDEMSEEARQSSIDALRGTLIPEEGLFSASA